MYSGLIFAVPLSIPVLLAMDLPFGAFWDAATCARMRTTAGTRLPCRWPQLRSWSWPSRAAPYLVMNHWRVSMLLEQAGPM